MLNKYFAIFLKRRGKTPRKDENQIKKKPCKRPKKLLNWEHMSIKKATPPPQKKTWRTFVKGFYLSFQQNPELGQNL